jgi:hypothetical protein
MSSLETERGMVYAAKQLLKVTENAQLLQLEPPA